MGLSRYVSWLRSWRIKDDWIYPLSMIWVLGWLPISLGLQALLPGGLSAPDPVALWVTLVVWFGPAILFFIGWGLVSLVRLGFPLERVDSDDADA